LDNINMYRYICSKCGRQWKYEDVKGKKTLSRVVQEKVI
jgi:DNA-directed RNA polymerase subunit RPC12/RpoP